MRADDAIEENRRAHDRVADVYEANHPEIFNPIEQERLGRALQRAVAAASEERNGPVRALDLGCGTGNLTRHLLALGAHVTAADLSPKLLAGVMRDFGGTGRVTTLQLNGRDLRPLPDGEFDLVATYSVLHHVPDYGSLVSEMARVTKPGGIVMVDHEQSDSSWTSETYRTFLKEAVVWPPRRWWYFLQPARYWKRVKPLLVWQRWLDPRWMAEGDLHIWPDDHVEWARIESALRSRGAEVVHSEEYLLYEPRYRHEAWESWRERCSDMRLLLARKCVDRTPSGSAA